MVLNYNNSIPLYIQLKSRLEQHIIDGFYQDRIPSEREIMDEFYVSRSTVRQAIGELVSEGVLERRPGRGTFVALKPIDDWLGNLSSTSETIDRMGMKPGAKLIFSKTVELPPYIQQIIGFSQAYQIKRIRYADDLPIGIESSYYPESIGNKLANFDLNNVTLYDLLEVDLGIRTKEADQVIRAAIATNEETKLLGVNQYTPVLNVSRKLVDIENRLVEYEQAVYRADMYSFKIKLARNQ